MYKSKLSGMVLLALVLSSFLLSPVAAAQDDYKPAYNPQMHITKTNGSIHIDGELDDAGWKQAAKANNFAEHRPGDQTEPPVNTEAFITYNDDNLYVAFICYDDPSTIRARRCDRDAVGADDNICLLIDTYGEASWAYEFNVTPYGIQGDYLWSLDGGEDENFDVIWESAGKITDSGYQLEMAIPFSSLRFPDQPKQTWKVDFWRNHPRDSRRQYSWAAYDRDEPCWPCQWGTITGIENVKPGRGIEILPSVIGFQSGALDDDTDPHSSWKNEDIDGEASIGAKYSLSSNMTAEVTYNPDFSQVESDAAQIDVNKTFALYYPERRPFFQEGSDLFNTYLTAVYTRSINNPLLAAKLVGRMNRTSIAFLSAYDEDSPIIIPLREESVQALYSESISNIFRLRHTLGAESHFGLLLTDRRFTDEGHGTTYGIDGALRFKKNYKFEFQYTRSDVAEINEPELIDTTLDIETGDGVWQDYFDHGKYSTALDGESFGGHNMYASFEIETRNFTFDLDYNEESPTFRADNGFIFMNSTRSTEAVFEYRFYHDSKIFDWISPGLVYGRVWKYDDGTFKDEWVVPTLAAMLKGQTQINIAWLISREDFRGKRFNSIRHINLNFSSNFSRYISPGGFISYGNHIMRRNVYPPVMGRETEIELWAIARPTERLKISPTFVYSKAVDRDTKEYIYDDYIIRSKFEYQLSRELKIRLVTQYRDYSNSWEFDPLITYKMNAFTIFYMGSTHDFIDYDDYGLKQYEQQFFFKLQYLVQI